MLCNTFQRPWIYFPLLLIFPPLSSSSAVDAFFSSPSLRPTPHTKKRERATVAAESALLLSSLFSLRSFPVDSRPRSRPVLRFFLLGRAYGKKDKLGSILRTYLVSPLPSISAAVLSGESGKRPKKIERRRQKRMKEGRRL